MITKDRYVVSPFCDFNVSYHILWCTRCRRKVLVNGADERLKQVLREKAETIDVTIKEVEVLPDYVHMMVKTTPAIPVQHIVNQLKKHSSAVLDKEFPKIKGGALSLWTRSYYVETFGFISYEGIDRYLEKQKKG